MSSVNKCILLGNVCADPEIRRTSSGDAVVNLRIATNERWRDKNSGERKEKSEFHNVVIFNEGIVKAAEQYVKKGSKVYIEGSLQTRKWQDQSGADKYTTEIVLQKFRGELTLLDSKPSDKSQDKPAQSYGQQSGSGHPYMPKAAQDSYDDDSEIPF